VCSSDLQVHLRGVVTTVESAKLQTMVDHSINLVLRDRWKEFARPLGDNQLEIDWVGLQTQIARELLRMLRREFQSNPLLVFLMQNAEEPLVKASSRTRRAEAAIAS